MCTAIRFSVQNGGMFFGRNLDWECSYGEQFVATPKGFEFPYRHMDAQVAKHAIIGMGIAPANYPLFFDCANDAGLAVAGLNFPQTHYYAEAPVEGKINLASFEFDVWVTSNFSTVDEVEAELANVVITNTSYAPGMPSSPMHFIIADTTRSIVAEPTREGLKVYHNDVDVLTNEPNFEFQRMNLRNYLGLSVKAPASEGWGNSEEIKPFGMGIGMRGVPGDYYPTSRFVKVAFINNNYPAQDTEAKNVTRLFRTLDSVAVPLGAVEAPSGEWDLTLYQSGYSSATRTYYYSTYDNPTIQTRCLDDVDFGDGDKVIVL